MYQENGFEKVTFPCDHLQFGAVGQFVQVINNRVQLGESHKRGQRAIVRVDKDDR